MSNPGFEIPGSATEVKILTEPKSFLKSLRIPDEGVFILYYVCVVCFVSLKNFCLGVEASPMAIKGCKSSLMFGTLHLEAL